MSSKKLPGVQHSDKYYHSEVNLNNVLSFEVEKILHKAPDFRTTLV